MQQRIAAIRPFVGRADALGVLYASAERCLGGHPQVLLIRGPAGVGKTALIRCFLPAWKPPRRAGQR